MSMKSISVIIPVYNSEQSLPLLVDRLKSVLTDSCKPFEVILINDGSSDGSWETIVSLSARFPWIQGINLMRNYGQHNALLCGIRQAKHDLIVTIDDDLQNPPEEIPRLLAQLEEGYDVVYGTPQAQQHGLWRDLASMITKMVLQGFMGAETARQVSAFRAFRTDLRDAFRQYQGSFVSIDVLLTWGTVRFSSVPVRHEPRTLGKSNYTFSRLLMHAVNMLTGFSILPLQVASFLGFACTIFGLCILIYVLVTFLVSGNPVPGFPFLASIIAIFSGAQLLALGIIGEYLARMHFLSLGRPPSVIRNTTTIRKGETSLE
ncbi:MAG: glycosyl transferase [Deltaproteobacteria bacterium RBG_13_47_9]|nr:MAG: glycosyl transferase [Deltaproteobacteria bacterium RBG_13_47_9]